MSEQSGQDGTNLFECLSTLGIGIFLWTDFGHGIVLENASQRWWTVVVGSLDLGYGYLVVWISGRMVLGRVIAL